MSVWRSLLSLTRSYTCLVVPRTEVCWKPQCQNFHRSHRCLLEKPEVDVERRKARAMAETDRQESSSVTTTIKMDELVPGVVFPTRETQSTLIDGIPYNQLPIVNVKVTKNNTIVSCDKYDGGGITSVTAGAIGFRNARKGTSVAAQAVGINLADKLLRREVKNVRVILKGIGAGRLPILKGMQMGGVNIISITDNTPVHTGKRPRKQRRL